MDRIYHNFKKWEDNENGMYKKTCFMDEQKMIYDCAILLRSQEWLYEAMSQVTHFWFYSSEHNLTNINRNRQAWLGQAACCLVHGAPEYLTKIAWNDFLNEKSRKEANKIADETIAIWEEKHMRGYFRWQKLESEKMCLRQQKTEYQKHLITSNEYT